MTAPDTDRELLVLAAKAIGATEYGGPDDCRGPGIVLLNGLPTHYEGHGEFGYKWDPLTDDGDALRLAVKLGIQVTPYPIYSEPKHSVLARKATLPRDEDESTSVEILMMYEDDPNAATRLAIVRAAAEVGRAMP